MMKREQRNWKMDEEVTKPIKHNNESLLSKRLLVEFLRDKFGTQCF